MALHRALGWIIKGATTLCEPRPSRGDGPIRATNRPSARNGGCFAGGTGAGQPSAEFDRGDWRERKIPLRSILIEAKLAGNEFVEVLSADSGPGFSPEHIENLPLASKKRDGLGIGLSL